MVSNPAITLNRPWKLMSWIVMICTVFVPNFGRESPELLLKKERILGLVTAKGSEGETRLNNGWMIDEDEWKDGTFWEIPLLENPFNILLGKLVARRKVGKMRMGIFLTLGDVICWFFVGVQDRNITGWWQLKYFLFSPQKLGTMNPFWRRYFSRGLVQPQTRNEVISTL